MPLVCARSRATFAPARHRESGRAAPDTDPRELADTGDAVVGQEPE
jgi:hypothetical protein